MALLTEQDVINMRFKEPASVSEGYDQDEVDIFLDEVAETIKNLTADKSALENEVKVAQARVTELENQPAQPVDVTPASASSTAVASASPSESEAATGMLALAQQLHDQHVAAGKEEGERIVSEAKAEAERLVTEAQTKHDTIIAQLEDERAQLDRKLSELRDFERDYRARLRSYLETLLGNVENVGTSHEG